MAALEVEKLFKSFHFETSIEEHPVLLNYPLERSIGVHNPDTNFVFNATLKEDVVDDGNEHVDEAIPTFNGYAPSGEVQGKLIYANYGSFADYEKLDELGIDFEGAIVIVRYGKLFRGDKCRMAALRGAVGCIIYSDPADDGYVLGPVYPEGPFRAPTSVQRGSVWVGNGDPATPGYPSTKKTPRLTYEEAQDPNHPNVVAPLPKIPIQPISYQDAQPLLEQIRGLKAPENFQGGLNLTEGYHIGPGPAIVDMDLKMNYSTVMLHNVFGKIRGSVEPDRVVIIGCHRDAWTYGAGDPISGTVSMLEIAKAFGKMYEKGWRPRRTIVFASWDGEEYGLIGSVEFIELHFSSLFSKAVAYLNLDIAVEGTDILVSSGTPSLKNLFMESSRLVNDPNNSSKTLYDVWIQSGTIDDEPIFRSLGSGSDFMGFVNHVGVASSAIAFYGKEGAYNGVYHSNYDSHYWYSKFGDPTFEYHAAISKYLGLIAKQILDSWILPYDYVSYAKFLTREVVKMQKVIEDRYGPNDLSFDSMFESLKSLNKTAYLIKEETKELIERRSPSEFALRNLNDRIMSAERGFLSYYGIPHKRWHRHMLFSPSDHDSYAGAVFPSIINEVFREPLNWDKIQEQIELTSLYIDIATDILKGDQGLI